MNLISMCLGGIGTAKMKRFRRGTEKNWNQYDECLLRLLKHTPKSRRKFMKLRQLKKRDSKKQFDIDIKDAL